MNEAIQVKNSGIVFLKQIDDGSDGALCILEANRDIPFDIKRVYYITNLQNARSVRGKHAHKTLWQAIFCISGSFKLRLDDGTTQQDIQMWRNNQGVILGPGLWHSMTEFSSGCVLLIVASAYFDETDYIREYDEFISFIRTL